jgi:hypothetical protein
MILQFLVLVRATIGRSSGRLVSRTLTERSRSRIRCTYSAPHSCGRCENPPVPHGGVQFFLGGPRNVRPDNPACCARFRRASSTCGRSAVERRKGGIRDARALGNGRRGVVHLTQASDFTPSSRCGCPRRSQLHGLAERGVRKFSRPRCRILLGYSWQRRAASYWRSATHKVRNETAD